MRRFSVFTAPFYSFFSRELYRDVGANWRGASFGYLLFLLALSWIPFMVTVYNGWTEFSTVEAPVITEQIPPISIVNGRMTADVEQPYKIRTTEPDELFAIIDTTGQVTSLDGSEARLLLTETALIARKSEAETRFYDLSEVEEFHLDGPTVQRWLNVIGTWGVALLYPFAVIGSYAYRLIQALFYAAVGLLLGKALGFQPDYGRIYRIVLVAITPAVLLKTLVWMGKVDLPLSWLIYFGVGMVYLGYGISSCGDLGGREHESDLHR